MRKDARIAWMVLAVVVSGAPVFAEEAGDPRGSCAVVDIDGVGFQAVERFKNLDGVQWWLELGDQLLLCGAEGLPAKVDVENRSIISEWGFVQPSELVLATGDLHRRGDDETPLMRGRRHALLRRSSRIGVTQPRRSMHKGDLVMRSVSVNEVILRQAINGPRRGLRHFPATTADLVAEVDVNRWFADLSALAAFNRYSYSDGIHDAELWIKGVMQAMSGIVVTTPEVALTNRVVRNVIGTLTGSERPDEWIIVGGHYDSTSQQPFVAAPGADDNASGCAGVLELARIFAANPPPETMLFICYAGEEQGLYGSEDHVGDLLSSGDAVKVKAMVNMDMIGYTSDSDLDCLIETDPFAYYLNDLFADAAGAFTSLRIVTSLFAWGSDHVSYLDADIPALLSIENEFNPYYHSTNDLPEHISVAIGGEILKMNVAGIDALFDQIFVGGFEGGSTDRWMVFQ